MRADKTLTCRDCSTSFTFTASEQDFFATKGFTNEPSRCPTCRAARASGQAGGANQSYSGSRSFSPGDNGRPAREMFTVVCAQCGKNAQVPFQPRGDKPVYCSDCFRARQPARERY